MSTVSSQPGLRTAELFGVVLLGIFLTLSTVGCPGSDSNPPSRSATTTAPSGPASATEFDVSALDIADPVERIRRFMEQLVVLEPQAFPEAALRLHGRVDEWAEFEARLFIWAWARHDPAGALSGALDWSLAQRNAVSYAAARSWARIEPVAAQEAVRLELEAADPGLATSLLSGLAFGWAENGDYDGALELVETRFSALVQREALTEMVVEKMLAAEGPAAAFEWAEQLAARNQDRAFLAIVFRKLGRNAVRMDAQATAEWLDRFEGDPAVMNRARRAAAVAWGRDDARAALAWMLSQPADSPRRESGLTTILADWTTRDADAALAWLRETRADRGLDPGVARGAELVARRSPRTALEWVGLVRDPVAREDALVAVVATWMREDRTAALAWLDETQADDGLRERVRARSTIPTPPAGRR